MKGSKDPIFIVGCPRSGNTLIGCILNKHPKIYISFEQNIFRSLYTSWKEGVNEGMSAENAFMISYAKSHNAKRCANQLGIEKYVIYETIRGANSWSELLNRYMGLLAEESDSAIWGDKTPHHVGNMDKIKKHFSSANIIYVYRNPYAVINSLSNERFPHASNRHLVCAEIVKEYRRVFINKNNRKLNGDVFLLEYEQLIRGPVSVLKELCSFIGVSYTSRMLKRAPTEVRKNVGWEDYKGWGELRKPASQGKGSPRIGILARSHVNPVCRELGYDPEPVPGEALLRMVGVVLLSPFLFLRAVLRLGWRRRHPDAGTFFLNYVPTPKELIRWVHK
nr:sulfotransferase [Salinibacter ruber]